MTCRPNFKRQDHIDAANPAYLYAYEANDKLEIYSDWDYNNNGVPVDVWNRIIMRWRIDPALTQKEIDKLIEQVHPDIQELFDITDVTWDNGNRCREFSNEALRINCEIEWVCSEIRTEDCNVCDSDDCSFCRFDEAE